MKPGQFVERDEAFDPARALDAFNPDDASGWFARTLLAVPGGHCSTWKMGQRAEVRLYVPGLRNFYGSGDRPHEALARALFEWVQFLDPRKRYGGACIGGPNDGLFVAMLSPRFLVPKRTFGPRWPDGEPTDTSPGLFILGEYAFDLNARAWRWHPHP